MISFKNTIIGYDKSLIQTGELQLESGKFYSLIGKNGIGKTTLFNTLLGLVPAFDGEILINGQNIHAISPMQRARTVSHVPSRFEGVQHLTARDYIAMGRAPYTNFLGTISPEDWQIVDKVIAQLGIQHFSERDTSQLSDGERQIASIAKALVQQTPVILLDEPTAFLDYANRMSVQKILKEIAAISNVCIVQSSHDLELCIEFSDRLLVIDAVSKQVTEMTEGNFSKSKVIEVSFPELVI